MKRILAMLFMCVLMVGVIAMPVYAESAASKVETYCTVSSEGDCLVSTTVTLRLEAAVSGLTFPLPLDAAGITMNGSSVTTNKTGSAIEVDISKITSGMTGEFTLRLDYTIPEAVKVNEERNLQL